MELEAPTHPHKLARRLAADAAAGGLSALLISPGLAILDRAVVEQAATGRPLLRGCASHAVSVLRRPITFLSSKQLGFMVALYAGTYMVANSSDSLCKEFASESVAGPAVFASTFAVNVPLGVWKDVRYSQLFGAPQVGQAAKANLGRASPRTATAAFLVRDAITIFGSFTLPGTVSAMVPDKLVSDPETREVVTQLTVPMLSQVVATPIHLVGLDVLSRHDGASLWGRLSRTRGYLAWTTAARCFRIIPAFGFGVVANKAFRQDFHNRLSVT